MKRRTSFYLPKDAIKHLHVLSRTRAREVIEALLRKFMVVDDPRKFALFERTERHGQGRFPIPALPVHSEAGASEPVSNSLSFLLCLISSVLPETIR